MADFKSALRALGQGKITVEALSGQLSKLLSDTPQHATKLLAQLDQIHDAGELNDATYAELKRQINQYRRAHAAETEAESGQRADSTVFAQDDNFAEKDGGTPAQAGDQSAAESTRVLSDDEKPGGGAGVDLDISQEMSQPSSLDSSVPSAVPPSTGPSGTQWQQPQSSEAAIVQEMGPGSVIKDRFKLLDVLGVGGMGKVYKGIDLLKQEAKDKNPYMAIKLLNEDFKSHPEAFIALQRESSRQQKLAHPNIATVYDFDRIGGPGTPVFITMELMEGQPLNTYIKKTVRKQGGLPFDEAFTIIRQLGAALQYAHERRLVHSDFKPGNAFLCNDGTVKTLDFGIARAVKNPVTGEAEKTLFDPGKLGALTPAYASLEMLEGEEPDPRDDIYALGCVAYELLTGKHPFNKLPANTARDNGLVPAPVKGLNKKQNRALRHALAFKREDRSSKVEDFIEELEGKANWHKNPFVIAAAVLLVIGIGLIPTARNYLHQKDIQKIITAIKGGGKQTITAELKQIRSLSKADQASITDSAKEALQKYFANEISQEIDISGNNYNFPKAEKMLADVKYFYPDSVFLQQEQDKIDFNKKQKLADLYSSYIKDLNPDNPTGIEGTKKILNVIRNQIDPHHPLLSDTRPANAYRLAAEQAYGDGKYDQALSLIKSGLQTAPKDQRLDDLEKKVQNAVRVAQLNTQLSGVQITSLDDYKQHEKAIEELASLSSPDESPILKTLAAGLKTDVDKDLNQILKTGNRADAEALASKFGTLMSSLLLTRELTQVKLAHLSGAQRKQAIQQFAAADSKIIEAKLGAPQLDNAQWEGELLASVRELDSLTRDDPSLEEGLQKYRASIAKLYADRASNIIKQNRFDAAEGFIARGERFAPKFPLLEDTRTELAQAKAQYEKKQHIKNLKDQFNVETGALRVADAQKAFDELKTLVPAGDPFITTQGPQTLATSYAKLAKNRAGGGDYTNALALANAALKLAPANADMKSLRDEYQVEVNISDLSKTFKTATVFTPAEVADMKNKVNEIAQGAPTRYTQFSKKSESMLSQRINTLAKADENQAAALASAAATMFPNSSVLANLAQTHKMQPWPDKQNAQDLLAANKLTAVNKLLQKAAAGKFTGHPDVIAVQNELETKMKAANDAYSTYETARQQAGKKYKDLLEARGLLNNAISLWRDNPDYIREKNKLDTSIAAVAPHKILAPESTAPITASKAASKVKWIPTSSGRECNSGLAGYGNRALAICFDLVNTGWRGPMMVVVPAGGAFSKPFAIGKYEISVGDWSKYCALSGKCKPQTNRDKFDDPQTGITLKQAEDYVKWLSKRTGKHYRLPTKQEWEYAASEGGKLTDNSPAFLQIKGNLNCRVTLGDKILKGTGVASVESGSSNAWGLKNFVGNVQELVLDKSGGASAMGGSFSDSISNCDITTSRPYKGGSNGDTGFRVVMDPMG